MELPWYQEGLRFKCTGCGQCCTGAPGYVWISIQEIKALAELLNISEKAFTQKYTRRIGNRIALKEDLKNYDCIFLRDNKCLVYSHRPKQCRTFPWWKEHLKNPATWEKAAQFCEGINHPDAQWVSPAEIQKNLD